MSRFLSALALTLAPCAASAQELTLEALFEEACIAPFELFFGETEAELRAWGFDLYPADVYTEFDHAKTGMSGAYSSNPEDPFCMIYDPRADPESASSAARVLLGHYFDKTPKLVPAGAGLVAWGVPYGTCCDLTVQVDDTSPGDERKGATLTLLMRER